MKEFDELTDAQQNRMCDMCERMYDHSRDRCEGRRCKEGLEMINDEIEAEAAEAKAHENKIDNILLYGFCKMFSDQSTRLIGEIANSKYQHHFKQAVKYADKFLKVVEEGVKTEDGKKTMDIIITDLNKGVNKFRNELLGKE